MSSADNLSLITDLSLEQSNDPAPDSTAGCVSWCPPTQNWNPWIGGNIDEGPLATANLDAISGDLYATWSEGNKGDKDLQESQQQR